MFGMRNLAIVLALSGFVFINGCSPDPVAGGTSTSENGRVTGKVVASDGAAATMTQVMLIPASHDPLRDVGSVFTDTTDASGNYSFRGIAQGEYTLQSVHITRRTRGLRNGILVDDDSVPVSDDTLWKSGSISIVLPESAAAAPGYVYIPGTTISARLSGRGNRVVLDSVPPGTIPAINYVSIGDAHSSVVRYGVTIRPEETAVVRNTAWKYGRRLRLDMSASGTGMSQTVYQFPVLVRLNGGNFDFSKASSDGADLMFARQNDSALSCEIERWDPVSDLAEVWVKIDTLSGNAIDTGITMYWGNPKGSALSTTGAVFDTAAGFSAVWHLGETNSDTLKDVTANGFHGLLFGSVKPAAGMIGRGLRFDSAAGYCEMGNILNPGTGSFTVSAWVKRAATGLQTIMAKTDGGSPSADYGWSLSFHTADQLHLFTASGGSNWGAAGAFDCWSREDATVTDSTTWHYAVAVVDRINGKNCRLYIDGEDVTGGASGNSTALGLLINKVAFRIGAEADGDYQWTGLIDECVIAHTVRSEAWVRLCYGNQGSDDRLVAFMP